MYKSSSQFDEMVCTTSRILCACQLCMISGFSRRACCSRILHERFLYPNNAHLSCTYRSRGLQVWLPTVLVKKLKLLHPGRLCKAHSEFSSRLDIRRHILYRADGVDSVTALAIGAAVRRAVGRKWIADRDALRHWPAEIERNALWHCKFAALIVPLRAAVLRDVSVEQEMGTVRLDGLVAMVGLWAMTTVAALMISSQLLMVMPVAVVVVLKPLDPLHVHSPSFCGHYAQPVPLACPVLHTQAQVYHGYWYAQHNPPGRYANRHTSGRDVDQFRNSLGEDLVAAVAVVDLEVMAVGWTSDRTARWAVDCAAGRALGYLAELTADGAWAVQTGVMDWRASRLLNTDSSQSFSSFSKDSTLSSCGRWSGRECGNYRCGRGYFSCHGNFPGSRGSCGRKGSKRGQGRSRGSRGSRRSCVCLRGCWSRRNRGSWRIRGSASTCGSRGRGGSRCRQAHSRSNRIGRCSGS